MIGVFFFSIIEIILNMDEFNCQSMAKCWRSYHKVVVYYKYNFWSNEKPTYSIT